MANRFPGKACVLCGAPSVGVGEHVWPTWLLDDFDHEAPFTAGKNGSAFTRRDGLTPIQAPRMFGVHVPMCDTCNHALGSTVEEPAKPVVRRILQAQEGEPLPDLDVGEAEALTRWAAKVAMFLQHPEASHDNERVDRELREGRDTTWHPKWASWLLDGSSTPAALSVFATHRAWRWQGDFSGTKQHIFLPKLSVDGEDQHFMAWGCGLRGLDLTVVWHPYWKIEHPMVRLGRATRVWPASATLALSSLPLVDPREFTFVPGLGRLDLSQESFSELAATPLGVDVDPFAFYWGNVSDA